MMVDSHGCMGYGEYTHYICENEDCECSVTEYENGEVYIEGND